MGGGRAWEQCIGLVSWGSKSVACGRALANDSAFT
jgi:hypothetical protein